MIGRLARLQRSREPLEMQKSDLEVMIMAHRVWWKEAFDSGARDPCPTCMQYSGARRNSMGSGASSVSWVARFGGASLSGLGTRSAFSLSV